MKKNKLEAIIKDSGLETTKAKVMFEKFRDYFDIAAEWEVKARGIVVKHESQIADMQMARVGRLFLREKRIAIEKTRKELKEQALREGKSIDGIANVLKGIIVPIEEYLNSQERFVEIKKEEENERLRLEFEKEREEKRILQEKIEAENREKQRLENIKLKQEAEAAEVKRLAVEKKNRLTRESQERKLAKTKEKAEAEKLAALQRQQKQKQETDRLATIEREKSFRKLETERMLRIVTEEREHAEREEKERLQKELDAQIECPKCHHKFKVTE